VFKSKQENRKALSLWPNKKAFNAVQQWLLRHNCKDPNDFVDGACEPLALYLSTSILSSIVDGSFLDVMHSNEIAKTTLKEMKPEEAAKTVFEKFINNTSTFMIWDPTNQGAYGDYLFGNEVMKTKVISAALQTATSNFCMPLYVLSYLYDTEKLTHAELLASKEESAQYSLHAVGLVFHRFLVFTPKFFLYAKMYSFLPQKFSLIERTFGSKKGVKPKMTRVSVLGTDAIMKILK
jgi:hypothetical protein